MLQPAVIKITPLMYQQQEPTGVQRRGSAYAGVRTLIRYCRSPGTMHVHHVSGTGRRTCRILGLCEPRCSWAGPWTRIEFRTCFDTGARSNMHDRSRRCSSRVSMPWLIPAGHATSLQRQACRTIILSDFDRAIVPSDTCWPH